MTIFKSVSIPDLSTGTALVSLGFTDYPALKADLSYQSVVPDWRRDAAAANSLENDASGADISLQPRTLFNLGSAIVRTEAQLNEPVGGAAEFAILLAQDDKNFIAVARTGYPGTQILAFILIEGGVQQPGSAFPWQIFYNSGFPLNQYATLPDSVTLSAVVNGTNLDIYVDGVKQFIRNTTTGSNDNETIPIPASVQGGTKVGYWQDLYSAKRYARRLRVRDNAGRTEINSYDTVRATTTQSKLRIGVFCNVAGAANVQIEVYSAAGALIGSGGGTISGAKAKILIGPIPPEYEATVLRVVARNLGGVEDSSTILFTMPKTILQVPFQLGQNETGPNYYTGYWCYNDRARIMGWRYGGFYVRSYWQDLQPELFAGYDPTYTKPASDIGLLPNGSPTKFPDSGEDIGGQFSWWPGAGEYILDMSQAPDAKWTFGGTGGHVTTTLDYYGAYKHRVIIDVDRITTNAFGFYLQKDATKPNDGLPTTEWVFTLTSVDASDEMVWNKAYVDWITESGVNHIRYMSSAATNSPFGMEVGAASAANRTKPSDQCWTFWQTTGDVWRPAHPIEHIVQLHNHVDKHIWDCIPHYADESWIRQRYGYMAANLAPGVKVYVETSNERWNYGYQQTFWYHREGLTRGLGYKIADGCLSDAVFGVETGPHTIPDQWDSADSYTTGQQVLSDLHIWQAKVDIPMVGPMPKPDNGGNWQKIQDGLTALRRAHINQSLLNLSYIQDEFGDGYADRIIPIFAVWDAVFDGDFSEYIDWGDNWQNFHDLMVGAYYGAPDLTWGALTAGQRTAIQTTSGPARVQVFKDIVYPGMLRELDRYADHCRLLEAKRIEVGAPVGWLRMGVYEGGFDWTADLTAAGGDLTSLFNDYMTFRKTGVYEVEYDFWKGLHDIAGGICTKFDMFTPLDYYFTGWGPGSTSLWWGVSKDIQDKASTSAAYRAVRDAAVDFAGGVVENLPYPTSPPPVPGGGFARYPVSFFLE